MSQMLNCKSGFQERKDKVFIFSFILSFSIHILLIFYILIGYKGEDKKKEIVWVSFHTAASGQKDMNVGIGGSTSESNEGSSAYQNNPSHLKSDSSPLKSNQNDEIKKEEKKEDKVKKENNNKDQQDRKEEIPKNKKNITRNKENIKAEKSKYSKASLKKSSNEKKEIAKAEKDIRSQNKQSVRKDEKNNRKESISRTAYRSDSKNTKSDRNDVKDKDSKDKKEKYGTEKYTAKDLDELEKALRELAKSYTGGGGSKGDSKGGEGSGGGSGGGNMQGGTGNGGAAQTFISLYAQLIRESIKKNFVIPPSLKGEFLSCVVYLKIGQDGSILDMDLEESSGNRNFDIFVMKAIRNSSPFPPPPSELEIYVRFSNRD
jgi:TolA protein